MVENVSIGNLLRLHFLPVILLAVGCTQADERVERSRAISEEFRQELGGELRAALSAGGPVNAIEFEPGELRGAFLIDWPAQRNL